MSGYKVQLQSSCKNSVSAPIDFCDMSTQFTNINSNSFHSCTNSAYVHSVIDLNYTQLEHLEGLFVRINMDQRWGHLQGILWDTGQDYEAPGKDCSSSSSKNDNTSKIHTTTTFTTTILTRRFIILTRIPKYDQFGSRARIKTTRGRVFKSKCSQNQY